MDGAASRGELIGGKREFGGGGGGGVYAYSLLLPCRTIEEEV